MEHDDTWVRELLEDAVADVTPRGGVEDIHARTAHPLRPHRRAWLWGAGAAVVATAATVAAVVTLTGGPGASTSGDQSFASRGSAAGSTAKVAPNASSTPAPTVSEVVYYLGRTPHGPRLYRESHQVPADGSVSAAVRDALSGAAQDPDYRSPWPTGVTVGKVVMTPSHIVIPLQSGGASLTDRPSGMKAREATLAIQQLVYTAQDAWGQQKPVLFEVGGQQAGRLLGVDVTGGVKRAPDTQTQALVWVLSPGQGAKVHSPFTVKGLANAFEANVVWELKQNGHVVKQGHTSAQQAYVWAPYRFSVKAPPGQYTLVVHDSDASGRGQVTQDTKAITVLP